MDNFSRICEALPHAEEHTARGLTSDARPYPGPKEHTEPAKGLRRLLSALRTDENAAVLGRLLQALATHFPSARPSEVLCLWRGGNTQARHMLQKACILGGITLALAYEDEDISSLITAMRHPPLGVLAVGEKAEPPGHAGNKILRNCERPVGRPAADHGPSGWRCSFPRGKRHSSAVGQ